MRIRSPRVSSRKRAAPPQRVGFWEAPDDGDLLAIDDDGRVPGEPALGQASGDPLRRVGRVGLLRLMPAAGAAAVMLFHDYMITLLQRYRGEILHERTRPGRALLALA
jgi:hypothetical protein